MSLELHPTPMGPQVASRPVPQLEYVVYPDRIIRLEPLEGTGMEPDVDEWLALPVGPPCPNCGGTYFGSSNCTGYLLTRHCHGDKDRPSCGTKFREPDDGLGLTAAQIVGRLLGYRRRFWVGNYPQHKSILEQADVVTYVD